VDKAGVAAVFFNGIAQINKHIFSFLREETSGAKTAEQATI
jgi:hypothetical protein